ncbi:hypothetical protein HK57_00226 [Aspergillus ustus]|uniref:Polyketide synthase n=1 Tax=Aspergillus ustus TaxID=40382 RepID=A0A0C1C4C2_ASPUT|nr:hypothetical protein HK57_00226 [Aspergillus ustus]
MAPPLLAAVICGPQTIPPPAQCLEKLRTRLAHDPDLKPLREAVLTSPSLLSRLQASDRDTSSSLQHHLAPSLLADLRNWVLDHDNDHSHDFASQLAENLPNILLAPLTVLIHIVQYMTYLDTLNLAADEDDNLDAHTRIRKGIITQHGGFQGLCTGSLSATALACSLTRAQIGLHAATALNLAVCIGAYVDGSQHKNKEGVAFACAVARWKASSQRGELVEVLTRYAQVCRGGTTKKAYISVELDELSATITARQDDLPALGAELAEKSISLANLQLRGRYHSKDNEDALEAMLRFCDSEPTLRFPASTSEPSARGQSQHPELCLRSILTERANWYRAMCETVNALQSSPPSSNPNSTGTSVSPSVILELGLVGCITPTLAASSQLRIIRAASIHTPQSQPSDSDSNYPYPDNCIAIIGAACKYPGAESLDELWELISTTKSMHGPVPRERQHRHYTTSRQGGRRHSSHPGKQDTGKLTGNFISGAADFDAAFFGISPREATYMDPQQRIALQVAYRALESAGYFSWPSSDSVKTKTKVGVYLGAGGSDYSSLVDSQPPTAFSFTGTSRAFISGRIAHFFNLTGPALTLDTACSSSSVAIHTACSAILSGECSMALAGGVSIMCHPATHENLATANFLNSSGTPCRAFDAGANGYARGEGCGILLLKRLSDALADGDPVLGAIAGSATNSCGGGGSGGTSITVPVSDPQVALYREALDVAGMEPESISYVEAHGTGTMRGDPVEWHSLHEIFGRDRDTHAKGKVYVGSIKSSIGHTEAASGVAGVLKVLSMLRHARVPPQANFSAFNAVIPRKELRGLDVPRQLLDWEGGRFRAACVNNYGAAGNNTVLVVCQPPSNVVRRSERRQRQGQTALRYPIRICAQSPASLAKNCAALARWLAARTPRPSLPDAAFALAQRQNPSLPRHFIFEATSLDELEQVLTSPSHVDSNSHLVSQCKAKPVVLVFAGQTGTTIHLSKRAYELSALLRMYLDACDAVLRDDLGLSTSLFPMIFSPEPMADDIVMLHCAGFAVQYAVAMAWLDSGLRVERVIGHSFGQLTAMCVAGVLTLRHALRLVSGRAQLIQAQWGDEKGAMLSVKADRETVISLTHHSEVEIACFNGPTSHVLVGSEAAIEALTTGEMNMKIKMRRLNTSHGFHSRYIDAFLDQYLQLAREITYSTPNIPIETCSKSASWKAFTPELVVEHSRKPVYFVDAVHRIRERHGPCIWLEAGSQSKGVSLAKEALGRDNNLTDSFHGLQLGTEAGAGAGADPMQSLADTTIWLWKEGCVSARFWGYHTIERPLFGAVDDIPSYQFDETSYWLQPPRAAERVVPPAETQEPSLLGLANLSSPAPQVTRFEVNQLAPGIAEILRGREVLGGSLWPISLYLELASQAAAFLTPGLPWEFQRVRLRDFEIQASLGSKHIPCLGLRLQQQQQLGAACAWGWSLLAGQEETSIPHATGKITLEDQRASPARIDDDGKVSPASRGSKTTLLSATGSIVYRLLENVASYDASYQGIDSVTMSEDEAIAQVSTPQAAREWEGRASLNPILLDQFMLVAELHALATCSKRTRGEVFTCSGVQEVITAYKANSAAVAGGSSWTVVARQSSIQGRFIYYDTYVYDSNSIAATDSLAFGIRGAKFVKAASHVLQRVVDQANGATVVLDNNIESPVEEVGLAPAEWGAAILPPAIQPQANAWATAAELVHQLTGFPAAQITAGTGLVEIGMDSLATADLEHRIKELFGVDITVDVAESTATFGSLMDAIQQQGSPGQTADNASSLFSPSTGSSSLSTAIEPIHLASDDAMSKLCGKIAEYLGNADMMHPDMPLQNLGLDSLVAIELESALLDTFGVHVSLMQMYETVTPNALYKLLVPSPPESESESQSQSGGLSHFVDHAADQFAYTQKQLGAHCEEAGFADFFERAYPKQIALVLAYLIEAFAALGCDLSLLPPEASLPEVHILPKHTRVMAYYYSLLAEAGLITSTKNTTTSSTAGFIRAAQPLPETNSSTLYHECLQSFPNYRSELKVLHRTGANLAACLSGTADPLRLLFSNRESETETGSSLLTDVYTNSPMFKMGTLALGDFLARLLSSTAATSTTPIRILELGAGTGGTTSYLLSHLKPLTQTQQTPPIIYTFTDISPTLVARARKTFASYDYDNDNITITYQTLDVENIPAEAMGQYDVIISSNCIHATKDLRASCRSLHELLQPTGGVLCLLELTRDLPWLNLVFGLLDGWWAFEDAREHVLADEGMWKRVLGEAGFGDVQWSGDGSAEGEVYRLIVGAKRA